MAQEARIVQIWESIRRPESAVTIATLELIPVGIPDAGQIAEKFGDRVAEPEAEHHEILSASGLAMAQSLRWTLNPDKRTKLLINGVPLRCRVLNYSVVDISWQAGDGWPVYTTYCPRSDYHTSMYFPHAKVHQIVPEVGGFYWHGCYNPATVTGNQVTEVFFSVNDSNYDDNRGSFTVIVTGWS